MSLFTLSDCISHVWSVPPQLPGGKYASPTFLLKFVLKPECVATS